MNMLSGDMDSSGSVRGTEPGWRQVARHPLVVLALGLLAAAVFLLVLCRPFSMDDVTPGQLLVWRLLDGPGALLPDGFQWWLYDHAFVALLVLSGILLAVVPWYIADVRRRAARHPKAGGLRSDTVFRSSSTSRSGTRSHAGFSSSAHVTHERRETTVEFTEDGRLERSGAAGAGALLYSVADLRSMARATGIPWRRAYETEGGARAFLEILRAVHAGTSPVPGAAGNTAEDIAAARPGTGTGPGTVAGAGAGAGAGDEAGRGAGGGTGAASSSDSVAAGAEGFTSVSASSPCSSSTTSSTTSSTAWTSDFTSSGSVYTPTSLYDAERAERTVLGTDPDEDDGTEECR